MDLVEHHGNSGPPDARLEKLLGFLAQDPDNPELRQEAAHAAMEAGRYETCVTILENQAATDGQRHMLALAWLYRGQLDQAHCLLSALAATHPRDASLKFNLAYASALKKDYALADSLLDGQTLESVPAAGVLKLRVLHHLNRLDEALALAANAAPPLLSGPEAYGIAATIALDADQFELAGRYAGQAPDRPESQTVLGYLALEANDIQAAFDMFGIALAQAPENGRAWVGKGLAHLLDEDLPQAASDLGKGASLLDTHAGSWIAAGWASLLGGNLRDAASRMKTAVDLSPSFGEAHGSLAVVRCHDGNHEDARQHCEIALRLDPQCMSGALALSLLSEQAGEPEKAGRILQDALRRRLGPRGLSIARLVVRRN